MMMIMIMMMMMMVMMMMMTSMTMTTSMTMMIMITIHHDDAADPTAIDSYHLLQPMPGSGPTASRSCFGSCRR